MSQQLSLLAKFEVKKDQIDFFKSEALKLIDASKNEQGCIYYSLHQNNEKSDVLVFTEIWESEDALEEHKNTAHFKAFFSIIEHLIESVSVEKMTPIG